MAAPGTGAREALLATAERLFAERGVDQVSLNEITRSAGQRNASALQYHFGNKEGLLRAILKPHLAVIEHRRGQMLDALEGMAGRTLRDLARALVVPVAEELESASGRAYVAIMAQLMNNRAWSVSRILGTVETPARQRLSRMVDELREPVSEDVRRAGTLLLLNMMWHGLAAWENAGAAGRGGRPASKVYIETLIDFVTALLDGAALSASATRLVSRS